MAVELTDKRGHPVVRNGEIIFRADMTGAVIKGVDRDKRTMWITGTTETKDRDGDIIMLNGWDIAQYLKNPVFLWAHDYASVPIGAAKRVVRRREPKRLDFLIEFADMKDLWTFPELIMQMYADAKVNASSVGFLPRKHEPLEEKDSEEDSMFRRGRRFIKQELLELSGCAVPSNPEALANAFKGYGRFESLSEDRQKRLLEYLIDGNHPEKVEEARQVIEHQATLCEFEDELEPTKVFMGSVKSPDQEQKGEDPPVGKVEIVQEEQKQGDLVEQKQGAVLNRKNKELLSEAVELMAQAVDNIASVLESAEPPSSEEEVEEESGKGHFEYLLRGELPKTEKRKPKPEGSADQKKASANDGKDQTDKAGSEEPDDSGTSTTEETMKRLSVFVQEVRRDFADLFGTGSQRR